MKVYAEREKGSLCGGSLLASLHAKPPLKGEVPAICGRRGSSPHAAKVAAALSAAVTTTKSIGDRLYFQAERPMQKQIRQTPAALREGARGRGFSQRSRLPRIPRTFPIPRSGISPRISQSKQSLRKGARGRGLLYREAPSLASLMRLPPACYRFALFGELGVEAGGGPEGVRGG